jgi:hypothetical protein
LSLLKQKLSGAVRRLRAFLISGPVNSPTVGTRPNVSGKLHRVGVRRNQAQKLKQAEQQIAKQRQRINRQSRELGELRTRFAESVHGNEQHRIDPANVIWILGTGRTGSTWLAFMMEELESCTVWREPYVGQLFGQFYESWVGKKHFETKHFILARRYKESWLKSMRSFILNEATVRFPAVSDAGYLVVKEPNGSIGAPLLLEALPESRMIFLIRDPRDVMASSLEAYRKGSWLYERWVEQGMAPNAMFDMQVDALVEKMADMYMQNVGNTREAYEAHKSPKVLVHYEELRVDTLSTMKRIYSTLGIPVDERQLELAVKKHSWESIPEEAKGEGKFHRKATPGGWREDLTPEQVETVERITAPLLEEFYSYEEQSKSLPDQLASSRQWMRMIYGP